MSRHSGAALGLVVAVLLAGCGTATSSSTVSSQPDAAGRPTWGGCAQRRTSHVERAPGVAGATSATAALAPYRTDGDHVVAPADGSRTNRQWLLVDDTDVIRAAVRLAHGESGWLALSVERCAD